MFILSYYLIASLISVYWFNPRNTLDLWKGILTIPLILTAWYTLNALSESNHFSTMYNLGATHSKCAIPLIISCVVTYFLLKRKMKNGGKAKFPVILFAFIIITLGLGLYQSYLRGKTEDEINRYLQERAEKEVALNERENALNDIRETAKIFRNKLPIYAGDGIFVYNVEFDEDKNDFITYYRDTEVDKNDFTEEDIGLYESILRENLLKTAKNNTKNKSFVKAGTTLTFKYEDKYRNPFLSISLYPNEYE